LTEIIEGKDRKWTPVDIKQLCESAARIAVSKGAKELGLDHIKEAYSRMRVTRVESSSTRMKNENASISKFFFRTREARSPDLVISSD